MAADGAWGLRKDGGQHETKEEDDKSEEGAEAANWIEGLCVVNGRDAKKAHSKKHRTPDIPRLPEMKQPQRDESKRHKKGRRAMQPRAYRTEDVAAIQLPNGEQVHGSHEQTDPRGAADGRQEKRAGVDAGMHDGVEKSQQQRHAKGDVGVTKIRKTGHEFRVKYSVE